MSDTTPPAIAPIAAIKAIVDLFADLGIDPLNLHVDGSKPLDARPNVQVWCRYRTDFERVIERMGLTATERKYRQAGQREWYAERSTEHVRLLVQCVSFKHHDDWDEREAEVSAS